MRWILVVIVFSTVSLAQPVEMFEIPFSGVAAPLEVLAVANDDNIADVFVKSTDGSVYKLTYDLVAHEVIGTRVPIALGSSVRYGLLNAASLGNGQWAVVLSGCFNCSVAAERYQAFLITGSGNVMDSDEMIYDVEAGGIFATFGPLTDARIARHPEGGFFVTGSATGMWGVEPTAELFSWAHDLSAPYYSYYSVGDHIMRVFPQFLTGDTLLILSTRSLGGTAAAWLSPCLTPECSTQVMGWDVSLFAEAMLRTPGGRIIAWHGDQITELLSDGGLDTLNDAASEPHWSARFAAHPDYGFAAIWQYGQSTMLARVDTNGSAPAADGSVAWNVVPQSAFVSFDGDGALLAGYAVNDTTVGLTRVPWTAPLNVPAPPMVIPKTFLLRAFPNPFNSSVSIEYDLQNAADVRLSIFNTLGQEIATLVDGRSASGTHRLVWSPAAASGVYFVKLTAGELVTSQKILYIR
ncbi:MAG: T9SS type A sorting domain-containing protein [bacterium]|nr:T9SS type A sorting domain-containing protein [bacterium]